MHLVIEGKFETVQPVATRNNEDKKNTEDQEDEDEDEQSSHRSIGHDRIIIVVNDYITTYEGYHHI